MDELEPGPGYSTKDYLPFMRARMATALYPNDASPFLASTALRFLGFVDEAYGVRSKILHEGLRAPELSTMTQRLEDIIRQIYASMFELPLVREPFPVAAARS